MEPLSSYLIPYSKISTDQPIICPAKSGLDRIFTTGKSVLTTIEWFWKYGRIRLTGAQKPKPPSQLSDIIFQHPIAFS